MEGCKVRNQKRRRGYSVKEKNNINEQQSIKKRNTKPNRTVAKFEIYEEEKLLVWREDPDSKQNNAYQLLIIRHFQHFLGKKI